MLFWKIKRVKSYIKIILIIFAEKFWFGQMAILIPKVTRCYNFRFALQWRIKKKLCNKKGEEVGQNYINGFSEKKILWGKLFILMSFEGIKRRSCRNTEKLPPLLIIWIKNSNRLYKSIYSSFDNLISHFANITFLTFSYSRN